MFRGSDWIALVAKAGSIVFAAFAAFLALVALKSVYDFLAFGPEKGATGVFLIDSMFGGFALFIMSRFLWIYAVKRQRRVEQRNEIGES